MTYHVFNTEAEVLSADGTKLSGRNAETGEFVGAFTTSCEPKEL